MATTAADVLIDALCDLGLVVDPYEPPMTPKVTFDQTTKFKFAQSLAIEQPHRGKIALTVLRTGYARSSKGRQSLYSCQSFDVRSRQ